MNILVGGTREFIQECRQAISEADGVHVGGEVAVADDLHIQLDRIKPEGVIVPAEARWIAAVIVLVEVRPNVRFFIAGAVTRDQWEMLDRAGVYIVPGDPERAVRASIQALKRLSLTRFAYEETDTDVLQRDDWKKGAEESSAEDVPEIERTAPKAEKEPETVSPKANRKPSESIFRRLRGERLNGPFLMGLLRSHFRWPAKEDKPTFPDDSSSGAFYQREAPARPTLSSGLMATREPRKASQNKVKAPLSAWLKLSPDHRSELRGELLVVYSSASGVGKTAVSLTIAALVAEQNRVCLIDADPTGHTLTEHFAGLPAGRYAFKPVRPQGWKFDIVPGPLDPSGYTVETARSLLGLREQYDLLVVDSCPGTLEVYAHIREFLACADHVWLLCTPEAKAVGAVKRFALSEGRLVPCLEEKLTFVVNRSYPLAPRKPAEVATATGFVLGAVLPEDSYVENLFSEARPPRVRDVSPFLSAVAEILDKKGVAYRGESSTRFWQGRPGVRLLEGRRW